MGNDILKCSKNYPTLYGKSWEVSLTNKVPFDRPRMEALLPELKYIGVTATGCNIIDTSAARELGIAVTNIPAYSTDAVAQHVFAMILETTNSVALHDSLVKEGEWERSEAFCFFRSPLVELAGKRLGIVGLGNIGRRVASIAMAFGMEVVACSPRSRMDGVGSVTLEELYGSCDYISLHCPQIGETTGMVNAGTLSKFKRGAVLVNASRGGLVDPEAVIAALDSGILSWYCADVLATEPPKGDPLQYHPRTIITPHIAWAPKETRERLLSIAAGNLRAWMEERRLNRVDL